MTVRSPAFAGVYYPAASDALDQTVRACLAAARADPVPAKAIVAPHARYTASGAIAGTAFRSVAHLSGQVTRIILLSPAHRVPLKGIAATTATGFVTPLGTIPVDTVAVQRLLSLPDVHMLDHAFDNEHGIELELPFIQTMFRRAGIVPLLVGEASAEAVDAVLEELWGGPETLIVVSSDLSHYRHYDAARSLDLRTSQAIESIASAKLNGAAACGYRPLAGVVRRAAKMDLRATTWDLRNSGDTVGPREKVVGYGAYTFEDAEHAGLAGRHRAQLLDTARRTLRHIAAKERAPQVAIASFPMPLRALRNTFVTLELDGRLRGCVGSLVPYRELISDVVGNTYNAARKDHRMRPMDADELNKTKVTISILSHPRPVQFASEPELLDRLRPGIDGLSIRKDGKQALFLPKVWSDVPEPRVFLSHLKRKAGLAPEDTSPGMKAFRFTTETFTD